MSATNIYYKLHHNYTEYRYVQIFEDSQSWRYRVQMASESFEMSLTSISKKITNFMNFLFFVIRDSRNSAKKKYKIEE